jgi:hypothetical protein
MFRWALRKETDKFELFSRVADVLAAAALVVGLGLAAPAAAHVSDQPGAASVYTMSPGRIGAVVAAVVGLIGAVIGGLALARSRRTG